MIFNLLFLIYLINAKIITNNIPICKNSIHFKPLFQNDFSSDLNKCKYFGTKNIFTDDINYEYAILCRKDESKCGVNGKYFEEDPNVEIKILFHNISKSLPFTLYFFIIFINIYYGFLNEK
jgi:hypothetical protein